MKWFKFGLAALFIAGAGWFFWQSKGNFTTPAGKSNTYYFKLDNALSLAGLKPFAYQYRDFIGEVEFLLRLDGRDARIVLSTKKDAYAQVAALQKIIGVAKIKGKAINLIDLSIRHPYATFENN